MQRKDGNLSKRASYAQRGRMGDAVALLPVCRSPPFAPCQQLSPYAPEISRRQLANLIMVAAALPAFSRIARAETYPSRPVRIIVGFPPGGAADVTARLIGQWLSERLGQPFIIENLSGAGTNIGTEAVAKSPADGYTLLLVSVANTVNATLYETLNFDFIRDITPVAGLVRGPLVMEVNPSVPAATVPEFIAYAKANPGITNIASAGIGTPGHMASELFQSLTGLNLLDVPYRGAAPAVGGRDDLLRAVERADELAEGGGRAHKRGAAQIRKLRLQLRSGETRIDLRIKLIDHLRRRVSGCAMKPEREPMPSIAGRSSLPR
jgi:hypothetical protein